MLYNWKIFFLCTHEHTSIYTQVGRSEANPSNGAEETWHTHLAQFLRDVDVDN